MRDKKKSYWTVLEKMTFKVEKSEIYGHFGPFGPKFRAFRVIQANPAS